MTKPVDPRIERVTKVIRKHLGKFVAHVEKKAVAAIFATVDPIPDLPTQCEACGEEEFEDSAGAFNTEIKMLREFKCGAKAARALDPTMTAWLISCPRSHGLLAMMKADGADVPIAAYRAKEKAVEKRQISAYVRDHKMKVAAERRYRR